MVGRDKTDDRSSKHRKMVRWKHWRPDNGGGGGWKVRKKSEGGGGVGRDKTDRIKRAHNDGDEADVPPNEDSSTNETMRRLLDVTIVRYPPTSSSSIEMIVGGGGGGGGLSKSDKDDEGGGNDGNNGNVNLRRAQVREGGAGGREGAEAEARDPSPDSRPTPARAPSSRNWSSVCTAWGSSRTDISVTRPSTRGETR